MISFTKTQNADNVPGKTNQMIMQESGDLFFDYTANNRLKMGGKEFRGTTTGSGSAYTLTVDDSFALTDGALVVAKLHAANAEACTINVNGGGAKPVKISTGASIAADTYAAGSFMSLRYNEDAGSFFVLGSSAGGNGVYGTTPMTGAAQEAMKAGDLAYVIDEPTYSFTQLTGGSSAMGYDAAVSDNFKWAIIGHGSGVDIYYNNGTAAAPSWAKRDTAAILGATVESSHCVRFSPRSNTCVIGVNRALQIFSVPTFDTAWTRRVLNSSYTGRYSSGISFSADGLQVGIPLSASPWLAYYTSTDATTWTDRTGNMPVSGACSNISFSGDGNTAVASMSGIQASGMVWLLSRTDAVNNTWARVSLPSNPVATNSTEGCVWAAMHPNGTEIYAIMRYYPTAQNIWGEVRMWRKENNAWVYKGLMKGIRRISGRAIAAVSPNYINISADGKTMTLSVQNSWSGAFDNYTMYRRINGGFERLGEEDLYPVTWGNASYIAYFTKFSQCAQNGMNGVYLYYIGSTYYVVIQYATTTRKVIPGVNIGEAMARGLVGIGRIKSSVNAGATATVDVIEEITN